MRGFYALDTSYKYVLQNKLPMPINRLSGVRFRPYCASRSGSSAKKPVCNSIASNRSKAIDQDPFPQRRATAPPQTGGELTTDRRAIQTDGQTLTWHSLGDIEAEALSDLRLRSRHSKALLVLFSRTADCTYPRTGERSCHSSPLATLSLRDTVASW